MSEPTELHTTRFWHKHGDRILLVALYAYVVILGIGVVAEAFDIRPILQLFP